MLPTSTILAAAWLSVNHLTCDPSSTEANDYRQLSPRCTFERSRSPTTFFDNSEKIAVYSDASATGGGVINDLNNDFLSQNVVGVRERSKVQRGESCL